VRPRHAGGGAGQRKDGGTRRWRCGCLAATLAALLAAPAPAAGEEELGNRPVEPDLQWPRGLAALVNDSHRVYRRWVNGQEDFYFQGGRAAVEAALARFAAVESAARQVVLMPAAGHTESFQEQPIAFDWHLEVVGGLAAEMLQSELGLEGAPPLRLFVHAPWLGAPGDQSLDLPAGVDVRSARDLEAEWRRHSRSARPSARRLAAARLGAFGYSPSAVDRLIEMCEVDGDDAVRYAAALALGRCGYHGRRALPVLQRVRAAVANEDQRAWIDDALQRLQEALPPAAEEVRRLARAVQRTDDLQALHRARRAQPVQPRPAAERPRR
jgi:hypothetical protein